jgi:MFS family permease
MTSVVRCYFNQGPRGPPFSDDEECSGPNSVTQGGITSAMAGGSWIGALCSGFVSDRLGRKYAIMVGCIIWWAALQSLIIGADFVGSSVQSSVQPHKTLLC